MNVNDPAKNEPADVRSNRRALHAYISDDAHDMWHDFAAENGVSVSALLEVLGSRLIDLEHGVAASTTTKTDLTSMILDARRLDASRRRRR